MAAPSLTTATALQEAASALQRMTSTDDATSKRAARSGSDVDDLDTALAGAASRRDVVHANLLPVPRIKTLLTDCGNRLLDAMAEVWTGESVGAVLSAFDPSDDALDRLRDHLLEVFAQCMGTVADYGAVFGGDVDRALHDRYAVTLVARATPTAPLLSMPEFLLTLYDLLFGAAAQPAPTSASANVPSPYLRSIMPADYPVLFTPIEQHEFLMAVFSYIVRLYTESHPPRPALRSLDALRLYLSDKMLVRPPLYDLQKFVHLAWSFRYVPSLGADLALVVKRRLVPIYFNMYESGRRKSPASTTGAGRDDDGMGIIPGGANDGDGLNASLDSGDGMTMAGATSGATTMAGAGAPAGTLVKLEPIFEHLDIETIAAFSYDRTSGGKSRAYQALVRLAREAVQQQQQNPSGPSARALVREALVQQLNEWRGGSVVDAVDAHLRRLQAHVDHPQLSSALALAVVLELPRRIIEGRSAFVAQSGGNGAGGSIAPQRMQSAGSIAAVLMISSPSSEKRKRSSMSLLDVPRTDDEMLLPPAKRGAAAISNDSMNKYLRAINCPKHIPRDAAMLVLRMVDNEMFAILFSFLQAVLSNHISMPVGKLTAADIDRCYAMFSLRALQP